MEIRPVVMVVEDEKTVRDLLWAQLEANACRVVAAQDGSQALTFVTSHCPDLVLLDLGLPDIDGMEVLTSIRAWSAVPIIIVSARCGEDDIVRALDQGADDYVTKPFSNSVLMARVRAALRKSAGGGLIPRHTFLGGSLCVDYGRRMITLDGTGIHLTPIEYKILTLLARNSGQVLTHAYLCRELWGPYAGGTRTLRVNMANLRRKIEPDPAHPRFIFTEVGVGYRMPESDVPESAS